MIKKVNIVVFDFDGTLSGRDANVMFIKYCFAHSLRPWLWSPIIGLSYFIMKYKLGDATLCRNIMRRFMTQKYVKKLQPGFIKQHKMERFGWAAEQVEKERVAGNTVLLISRGADWMIPKLVSDIKFDGIITSKTVSGKPWKMTFFNYGENKVISFDNWVKRNKLAPVLIRSYGDSHADRFIMARAQERIWIDPKTGLRRE
jgi:phosphoserine phosphatase